MRRLFLSFIKEFRCNVFDFVVLVKSLIGMVGICGFRFRDFRIIKIWYCEVIIG